MYWNARSENPMIVMPVLSWIIGVLASKGHYDINIKSSTHASPFFFFLRGFKMTFVGCSWYLLAIIVISQSSVKYQLLTYGFLPCVLLHQNIVWTLNLDQKVGCLIGLLIKMILQCQLSAVGTYYRQPVYFQYNNCDQLSSLWALSSQGIQSKSKKIIQKY